MEQLIEKKKYMVIFDDSNYEKYFEYLWEAERYAVLNDGLVLDRSTLRTMADFRPTQYEYFLRG